MARNCSVDCANAAAETVSQITTTRNNSRTPPRNHRFAFIQALPCGFTGSTLPELLTCSKWLLKRISQTEWNPTVPVVLIAGRARRKLAQEEIHDQKSEGWLQSAVVEGAKHGWPVQDAGRGGEAAPAGRILQAEQGLARRLKAESAPARLRRSDAERPESSDPVWPHAISAGSREVPLSPTRR